MVIHQPINTRNLWSERSHTQVMKIEIFLSPFFSPPFPFLFLHAHTATSMLKHFSSPTKLFNAGKHSMHFSSTMSSVQGPPPPNFRLQYRGGSTGGAGGGRPPPQLEHWGGIAPPTLGYNTKGCLRVHYCLYSVTVYTG